MEPYVHQLTVLYQSFNTSQFLSDHWSLLHYRQDTWVNTEMVRTCPATSRWPLHLAYPWNNLLLRRKMEIARWSVWTLELGKGEHHQSPHQPEPHGSVTFRRISTRRISFRRISFY